MLSAQLTAFNFVFIVNLTFVVVSILKIFKLGNEESQNLFKDLSQKYKEHLARPGLGSALARLHWSEWLRVLSWKQSVHY